MLHLKGIAFSIFLFFNLTVAANDTLTRAQVYNFNVGDTFDYRHYSNNSYGGFDTSYSNTSINYTRYVITNIYYSLDSATKYIVRRLAYPTPETLDTIILNDLQGQEVIIDTNPNNSTYGPDTSIINPLLDYFGRRTNYITFFEGGPGWEEILFAQGLGKVIDHLWGGAEGSYDQDSIILVYYANDSVVLGNPYYNLQTSVRNLDSPIVESFSLFPTINNGVFTVKIFNTLPFPVALCIYDLTGRKIKDIALNEPTSHESIDGCSRGAYIWKAIQSEQVIQTGKMIVY